jgi:predicted transcriptional regulator
MSLPRTKSELARAMRASGHSQATTARFLGVSPNTVRRWTDPEYAARQLRLSRNAKRRRTGRCVECGAETHYNGGKGISVSERCVACGTDQTIVRNHAKRGTGSSGMRVLGALALRPHRFTELRDIVGYPSNQCSSLLGRLMRYGLIVRLERGLYSLPERKA